MWTLILLYLPILSHSAPPLSPELKYCDISSPRVYSAISINSALSTFLCYTEKELGVMEEAEKKKKLAFKIAPLVSFQNNFEDLVRELSEMTEDSLVKILNVVMNREKTQSGQKTKEEYLDIIEALIEKPNVDSDIIDNPHLISLPKNDMEDLQRNGRGAFVHGLLNWMGFEKGKSTTTAGTITTATTSAPPLPDVVYLIAGGYSNSRGVFLYHPSLANMDCSITPPELNNDWSYHSTFYHDNTIHLCGGYDTDSNCISHTSGTDGWTTHSLWSEDTTIKKIASKKYHSSIVLHDRVYFIGGEDSDRNYPGAESTPLPLTDTPVLTPVPALVFKGAYPCAARIDQDTLVVTGGVNPGYLDTAAIYNVKTGAYTQLPRLKEVRSVHGCGVLEKGSKKWIMVAGGENGDGVMQTTEMLELGGSGWMAMGDLNEPRWGHSMAMTERGVMVMGGRKGGPGSKASVELLDWSTKTWSIVDPSLSVPRAYFGGAVEIPASMFGCLV